MAHRKQWLGALAMALTGQLAQAQPAEGVLNARIQGLQSANGKVGCWLWDQPKGYPTDPKLARALHWGAISGGSATVSFDGLAPHTYALACFHDENGNGKLDTNWLGIPNEGMVASNNARGRMGPPKFDDAKFAFVGPVLELALKVRY